MLGGIGFTGAIARRRQSPISPIGPLSSGRGSRPRCLALCIDLEGRVDTRASACLAVLDSAALVHIGVHRQYPPIDPLSSGRGSRPRCLALCIDLKDRVDYAGIGNAWWYRTHPCYCTSAFIVNIPQSVPSPRGRGSRPRCLALCIDLKGRVDYAGIGNAWWYRTHRCYCTSALIANIPQSIPSPRGEGADRGVLRYAAT
jgi:hypothetical protein